MLNPRKSGRGREVRTGGTSPGAEQCLYHRHLGSCADQEATAQAVHDPELRSLLDLLERLSQESGRSFFETRKAQLEHYYGNNRRARGLIEDAIRKTPGIFEPRRIYAEILLKEGDLVKAGEVVKWMREKVYARDVGERRTNYRPYLETEARYLTEMRQFDDAKAVYSDRTVFSEDEAQSGIKNVEIVQAYRGHTR